MKKWWILLMMLALIGFVGCGAQTTGTGNTESQPSADESASETTVAENAGDDADTSEEAHSSDDAPSSADSHDDHVHAVAPQEPGENEMCSVCNMVVYHRDHPMGRYTGQVVTADGQHLFTDDVGCLLNQIRMLEEEPLGAWVRDYNTLEWIPVDEAVPVRASIETPMKMGFALFGTQETAEQFLAENPMLSPVITTMADVDRIALERRKAKMKAAEEQATSDSESADHADDHGHEESSHGH